MEKADSLVLGILGIYVLAVVFTGHARPFTHAIGQDTQSFFPWVIAVILLALLAQNDKTKAAVLPIGGLLLLNVILRNFDSIKTQILTIAGSTNAQTN
jgi:hypothetical protein